MPQLTVVKRLASMFAGHPGSMPEAPGATPHDRSGRIDRFSGPDGLRSLIRSLDDDDLEPDFDHARGELPRHGPGAAHAMGRFRRPPVLRHCDPRRHFLALL